MNGDLLIAFFFFALLCQLRFHAYTHNYAAFTWRRRWLVMTGYVLAAFVLAILFALEAAAGLREIVQAIAEEMASSGVTPNPGVLQAIAHYYSENANPILLTLVALASAETIVLLSRTIGKLIQTAPPKLAADTEIAIDTDEVTEARGGTFKAYLMATLLAFFTGPLLAFSLASLDADGTFISHHASDHQTLTSVSYTLSPVFALYAVPSHWLGATPVYRYWKRGETFYFSPTYPSERPVRLTNLTEDAAPWLFLCLQISLIATIRARRRPDYLRPTFRQLLIGDIAWQDVWRPSRWSDLPWRGKLIYVAIPAVVILALVAISLQLLTLAFWGFAYGGWIWVVLIVLTLSVIKIGEFILRAARRKPGPRD